MSRQLEELNLIDNFLFGMMIDHDQFGPDAVRLILETILQREVKVGKIISEKVIAPVRLGLHGIRMDAYVQEDAVDVAGGEVFDLEPDRKENKKKELPRRARYYHSKTDGKLLQSMTNYGRLPKVWVIFITSYDPFGAGRMVYTVRRKCEELPELEYDDGDVTLFLYVKGEPEVGTPKKLIQLLRFIGETVRENACNPSLKKLLEYADDLRRDPEVKEAYMHWEVFIQNERDEAKEEERVKTRIEAARADAAENRASVAEQNALAAESRASVAEQNALAAENRASVAEQNALAAESRVSAVEEELARTKAELAALKKEIQKSDPSSI